MEIGLESSMKLHLFIVAQQLVIWGGGERSASAYSMLLV